MTMSDKNVSRFILRLVICDTHHNTFTTSFSEEGIALGDARHCGQTQSAAAPFRVASTFPPFPEQGEVITTIFKKEGQKG